MCGFAGYFLRSGGTAETATIRRMTDSLRHRGPDDEGYFFFNGSTGEGTFDFPRLRNIPPSPPRLRNFESFVNVAETSPPLPHSLAFGFRRYAVLDRSEAGRQPMSDGRNCLIFNGEIYNWREIRSQLAGKGIRFTTNSDAEVLLAAWRTWRHECFKRLRGPFAGAIFDSQERDFVLFRDALGEANLYWHVGSEGIFFASEIRAILEAKPALRSEINPDAVADYLLRDLRDAGGRTFWKNIFTFPAGSFFSMDERADWRFPMQRKFWEMPVFENESPDFSKKRLNEATERFGFFLKKSVGRCLEGDLKIGMSLSGGLDSSTIAGVFAKNFAVEKGAMDCYSVTWDNPSDDETEFSRAVCEAFPGTLRHHFVRGDDFDLLDEAGDFWEIQEEPWHDPVQFTETCLLRKMKADGIGVCLSGTGGDELLAGYSGAVFKPSFYRFLLKNAPVELLRELPHVFESETRWTPKSLIVKLFNQSFSKKTDLEVSYFSKNLFSKIEDPSTEFPTRIRQMMGDHKLNQWLRSGGKYFYSLPIEPRYPFLDLDFVEFCLGLPPQFLIHRGWQKFILRQFSQQFLPEKVAWRPKKMGFPLDTKRWMQQRKSRLLEMTEGFETPFFDFKKVQVDFDALVERDASLAWRFFCFAIWHEKIIRIR